MKQTKKEMGKKKESKIGFWEWVIVGLFGIILLVGVVNFVPWFFEEAAPFALGPWIGENPPTPYSWPTERISECQPTVAWSTMSADEPWHKVPPNEISHPHVPKNGNITIRVLGCGEPSGITFDR